MESIDRKELTVVELLIRGRKLIEKEENWTQGWYSRDRHGDHVGIGSQEAVSFCSSGALERVIMDYDQHEPPFLIEREADQILRAKMGGSTPEFNDKHTHAEVLAAWDAVIQEAKAREEAKSLK